MATITLATIGSLGDLHPILALARELKTQGYNTRIATMAYYKERVIAEGHEFAPLRPNLTPDDRDIIRQMVSGTRGTEYLIREVAMKPIRETYEDLLAASQGSDLLISQEMVYPARFVAAKLNIHWATLTLAPISFFSKYDDIILPASPWIKAFSMLGTTGNSLLLKLGRLATQHWAKEYHNLRKDLRLPNCGHPIFEAKHSSQCVLALFSPHFAAPKPDWPPHSKACGFPFYNDNQSFTGEDELKQFLAAGSPPLIFTLGSAAVHVADDFFEESYKAVKNLNQRAVFICGDNTVSHLDDENVFTLPYAPYERVFPHGSVIIHQGGIGTTAQALRSGKPQVVVPFAFDQPDNAHRVTQAGCGATCSRRQYKAPYITRLLSKVLSNSTIRTNAEKMGKKIQKEDGIKEAIATLNEVFFTK